MQCNHCGSSNTIKNGCIHRWKSGRKYRQQRHACKDCGRSTTGRRQYE